MQTIRLLKPKQFETQEISEPAAPGPGEALVRVHRMGICGSDFSGYLGKMPFFSYPRIPGHELGVEVLAVGPGVDHLKAGDHCSVEPYINCQNCAACARGRGNCCENLQVLGVHTDGGLRPPRGAARPQAAPRQRPQPRATGAGGDAGHRLPRGGPRRRPAR